MKNKKFNQTQSLQKISKHLSVLYVEDDKDLSNRIKRFLIKIFKNVDIAIDGQDGLNLYKKKYEETKKYYDIVISDIYMPNLNGIDMSRDILDINKDQKIVIISAYEEKKYLLDIISLGIDTFIQKPFDMQQLIGTLYKVCMAFQSDNLQYFKALTEASIVLKMDTNGVITYVNDKFCDVTGYTREDIIGNTYRKFKHPDTPEEVYTQRWDIINSGEIWNDRITSINKDGSDFISNVTIIPLMDNYGEIKEFMDIRNDVTKLVKIKRQLIAKEQEQLRQEHIKKAQKAFLVVFTHELKTPLNAIINFSKYIKKQMHNPQNINHEKISMLLDSVLSNSTDMLNNITQILEVSKLNAGKLKYTKTLFNADTLMNDIIKKFDSLVKDKNIKLLYKAEDGLFIYNDKQRVEQIISNVFSNAIKYGKDEICITLCSVENMVELTIQDNGNGIKDKEAVFNLYAQEDEELLNRAGQGTGVGLYFLKLLCRDLKIDYKIEDVDINGGTKFILQFNNKTKE